MSLVAARISQDKILDGEMEERTRESSALGGGSVSGRYKASTEASGASFPVLYYMVCCLQGYADVENTPLK